MPEEQNISVQIALRVLDSSSQCMAEPSQMDLIALRTLAESQQERELPSEELACVVLARSEAE